MRTCSFGKKKREKTAYFLSFSGSQYSDSPRMISEKLHEMAPDIKVVWCGTKQMKIQLPEYVKWVELGTIKSLQAQAQADVWVFNGVVPSGTYKRKDTFYIQTWHGDRAFKRIGLDAASIMGKRYTGYRKYMEPKICNLFITASDSGSKMMRSAFNYQGEILDVGMPRNDKLVKVSAHISESDKIRHKLGVSNNERIMIFAPTFRDHSKGKQNTNVDLSRLLNILEKDGQKWCCLMRAHTLSLGIENLQNDSRIIDATQYPDMADLLLVSDILITDYSSSAQDFVLTGRPVVLAQFDIEEYINNSRALYYDPMETGFLIAHNQSEIEKIFNELWMFDHLKICEQVKNFYGIHECGNSTELICKKIVDWCKL